LAFHAIPSNCEPRQTKVHRSAPGDVPPRAGSPRQRPGTIGGERGRAVASGCASTKGRTSYQDALALPGRQAVCPQWFKIEIRNWSEKFVAVASSATLWVPATRRLKPVDHSGATHKS